ncbi:amino acid permease [Aeromicrobium marinum DSM 15272]|uniref:Amino acid permease n=1 Tax=Aeromicrobium marinum DSM 15272 TaxID=585531 RepID=E2SBW7_9ACTN|nr:APC family permease [Aeromicrobium marinum]EFQ83253.1 amino acid permease [Aeromicrobium marinum DSM 15272]
MTDRPALQQRLGTADGIVVGLGAMLGAGIFAAAAPAAAIAGSAVLVGVLVAAVVALANATSSAQLSAARPASGGAYVHGRERLGPWWGYAAGVGFVVGKIGSCAAIALVVAQYTVPEDWVRPVAALVVVVLAAVNCLGVHRTVAVTRVLVALVLLTLGLVVVAALNAPDTTAAGPFAVADGVRTVGWVGVAQAGAVFFFAFAGYARLTTMGEEVRDPARTIPRAVLVSVGLVVVTYLVVTWATLRALGAFRLAESARPLADVVDVAGWGWAVPVVSVGAALAALGSLLVLLAGVARTAMAMAREADLPPWLAAVHPRYRVPHRAEIAAGAVVVVLVLTVDLRGAIQFSALGVLLYYLVANLAALKQPAAERLAPRFVQVLGAVACLLLVVTLPPATLLAGVVVGVLGFAVRSLSRRRG